MNKKLTGEELLKTAVNQILLHPETWNQEEFHSPCGTKHCIAGWSQILSGQAPRAETVVEDARSALEISGRDAEYLFNSSRTLVEIYSFATGYDLAGFNRGGYNRDGYDRDGYDRDGNKLEKL